MGSLRYYIYSVIYIFSHPWNRKVFEDIFRKIYLTFVLA